MTKVKNTTIGRSIMRQGRCQRVNNTGKFFRMNKQAPAKKRAAVADAKLGRWYAAEDKKTPIKSRKHNRKQTKLRPSITPGAVLICLAGRFRGKRVVFLKQLDSGLLLVTGPYKVNGVPLRRLNQAYVIGTSTSVDISGVNVDHIKDDFFARVESEKKAEEEFVSEEAKKGQVSESRKAEQKKVDAALIKAIAKEPMMKHYLNAKFSLTNGQKPHLMKF